MRNAFTCLSLIFGLAACNSGHDFVYSRDNLFVMSNPSVSNQEHFLVKGGASVVELSEASSQGSKKVSGLKYSNFVWDSEKWLSDAQLESIAKEVSKAGSSPVLIHSSDINKASAWLALHLVKIKKLSVEEALKSARESGLTQDWESKLLPKLRAKSSP